MRLRVDGAGATMCRVRRCQDANKRPDRSSAFRRQRRDLIADAVGAHLYGDETTHGEGYNMQQVVGARQGEFGRLTDILGRSYVLHTPEALRDALRRGTQTVHKPYFAGPFYLCLPINIQPKLIDNLNLEALPERLAVSPVAPSDPDSFREAADIVRGSARIVIKAGGGSRYPPTPFAGSRSALGPRSSFRQTRPAFCRTTIRSTCMSAAARDRSQAISRWRKRL